MQSSLPVFYQLYIQLVLVMSALFALHFVKAVGVWSTDKNRFHLDYIWLCFWAFCYSLLYWFRLCFPGKIGFIHMRHLVWILSLVSNTFYVETLAAYLGAKGPIVKGIRILLLIFLGLFIAFEVSFLITGHSLLFVESVRSQSNFFNVLVGVHTSHPTSLMMALSVSLSALVIFLTLFYLRLSFLSPKKELLLTIGLSLTFFAVINEIFNAMKLVESVSFLFASKGIEVFRIGDYLARERIEYIHSLKSEVNNLSKKAATSFIASGLMHDIRTPLAVLFAHVGKIKALTTKLGQIGDRPQSELREIYYGYEQSSGKLQVNLERIQSMIASYLELIKNTNNQQAGVCPLKDIINEAVALSRPRLEAMGVTKMEVGSVPAVSVKCVQVQAEMILANLFNNAIEAIKDKPEGKIIVFCSLYRDQVAITVSNTGEIEEQVLRKIVKNEPITTKGTDGNGIGLRIVAELCRANSAELNIYNSAGMANFEVNLPVVIQEQVSIPIVDLI